MFSMHWDTLNEIDFDQAVDGLNLFVGCGKPLPPRMLLPLPIYVGCVCSQSS